MKKQRRRRIRHSNPDDQFTVMVVDLGDGRPTPYAVPSDLLPKEMRVPGFDLVVDEQDTES